MLMLMLMLSVTIKLILLGIVMLSVAASILPMRDSSLLSCLGLVCLVTSMGQLYQGLYHKTYYGFNLRISVIS
jgi:hypothetical protein